MTPVDIARVGSERRAAPVLAWGLPLAVAGGALLAAGKLLGGPLALPVLSIALLAAGFLTAASAYLFKGRNQHQTAQSHSVVAGALVLLGFAAALLSDSEGALVALDAIHAGTTVAASK